MLGFKGWQGRLKEQLRAGIPPADELSGLGYQLNLWVTDGGGGSGGGARPDGVDPTVGGLVEVRVARYFDQAVTFGRKWGRLYGMVLGFSAAAIIVLCAVGWEILRP